MGWQRGRRWRPASGAVVIALCVALAACSGLGPSKESNPKVYGLYDVIPEGGGVYKVGDPYQVGGQWFYPREDPTYDRTGIASWYGEYFHGRRTANGEFYDMNRLSAAHPTLPLPVYARVTNLENGRSLVVRVNDRGPFKRNRVIDLSRAAAKELGFLEAGTAPVRVTYIADAPLEGDIPQMQMVDRGFGYEYPSRTASAAAEPPTTGSIPRPRPAPVVAARQQTPGGAPRPAAAAGDVGAGATPQSILPAAFYVQAAAFRDEARARTLAEELAHLGAFDVLPVKVGESTIYRVRTGPLGSLDEARTTAASVAAAGFGEPQVLER